MRSRRRHLFAILNISGAATIITLDHSISGFSFILLIYPVFILFLASGWTYNLKEIFKLSEYIRLHIEGPYRNKKGYETFLASQSFEKLNNKLFIYDTLSSGGLFIGTQLICIFIAYYSIYRFDLETKIVAIISCLSILLTIVIVFYGVRLKKRLWLAKD
ncbi:hypothetical protein SAMN06265219_111157 [Gracilimonas mengyeensis]|uniref:Uncharacterized protein n=2 Tax=Gracilimonas mengyeensis TaxID=1302730 RepID=A0A521EEC7_9BACT|nr:hypothetical protein SAMN06265219_111157 [Gracilimonas mengyeensis]